MSNTYTLNDLKWLWVEWLRSMPWGDFCLKEFIIHNTWKPDCECFTCWLERLEKKEKRESISSKKC